MYLWDLKDIIYTTLSLSEQLMEPQKQISSF